MAEKITIKKKDGSVIEFREKGRAGGSWTISIRYEGAFAIVTDEWGSETAVPSADIDQVDVRQRHSW